MNRRHFLLQSLAASAVSLSSAADARRIRIGQIGTAHAHASGKMDAMRALDTLVDVVGVVEADAARRGSAAKSKTYAGLAWMSVDELLAAPGLDAVAVETRIEDSAPTALKCIRAGKHIHLDKPGALEHAQFKRLRIEAEERSLTVQMGYMLRYNPAFELLFRAVREGWLGEITEIDAAMGKLADAGTRKTIGSLPGGGMFELGCHVIDAIVTLLGKPTSVQPVSTPTRDDGVKDNQTAVLRYPKAAAVVRVNHADPFGGPRRRFCVAGTKGVIDIQPMESGRFTISLSEPHESWRKGQQPGQIAVPTGRYDGEFRDLAKIIRGEKKLAWDAAHDIAVHETVLLAAGVM
ncbi:MAG: Gfo/Idh/MocA family oxidoreductase [Verrucomicrobiaceae bacterium]|nr:Gfo/Idh/MocA family oxidoreductase [Verrucomicrobiaceae bacterium]